MFGIFPLTGAYGRDYKSQAALMLDWNSGKDFQCINGQYCSKRDFPEGETITIRYAKLQKIAVFKNKEVQS